MGAFGDILGSVVSSSQFWKRPGVRDMTIFKSYVGIHILNLDILKYIKVYEGMWRYLEYMKVYGGV